MGNGKWDMEMERGTFTLIPLPIRYLAFPISHVPFTIGMRQHPVNAV
jgi:hypothetical protein